MWEPSVQMILYQIKQYHFYKMFSIFSCFCTTSIMRKSTPTKKQMQILLSELGQNGRLVKK